MSARHIWLLITYRMCSLFIYCLWYDRETWFFQGLKWQYYIKKEIHSLLRFCNPVLWEMKAYSQVSRLLAQQQTFTKYYIPTYKMWQHFHFLTKHFVKTPHECVKVPFGLSRANFFYGNGCLYNRIQGREQKGFCNNRNKTKCSYCAIKQGHLVSELLKAWNHNGSN